jgi:hypothetical protein
LGRLFWILAGSVRMPRFGRLFWILAAVFAWRGFGRLFWILAGSIRMAQFLSSALWQKPSETVPTVGKLCCL